MLIGGIRGRRGEVGVEAVGVQGRKLGTSVFLPNLAAVAAGSRDRSGVECNLQTTGRRDRVRIGRGGRVFYNLVFARGKVISTACRSGTKHARGCVLGGIGGIPRGFRLGDPGCTERKLVSGIELAIIQLPELEN